MSLDYSAVPRMPDGRTAAEHILTIEKTASQVVRIPMGNGGRMTWHVWDDGSDKPILLRVETKAGHGAGKPISKQIEETADLYSFVMHELGVPLKSQSPQAATRGSN